MSELDDGAWLGWEVFDPTDGDPVAEGLTQEGARALAEEQGLDYAQAGRGWL